MKQMVHLPFTFDRTTEKKQTAPYLKQSDNTVIDP